MSDDTGSTSSSPPGWYPYGEGRQAWWDGQAFVAFTPPAPPPPPPPPRPKPKIGKTAKIVLVATALLYGPVLFLIGMLIAPQGDVALNELPGTVPQDRVISELDGCQRYYYLTLEIQTQNLSNGHVVPRFRGLRDAARAKDPQLAAGLDEILEARGSIEVSDAMTGLLSHCVSTGNVTSDQVDVYNEALQAQ